MYSEYYNIIITTLEVQMDINTHIIHNNIFKKNPTVFVTIQVYTAYLVFQYFKNWWKQNLKQRCNVISIRNTLRFDN